MTASALCESNLRGQTPEADEAPAVECLAGELLAGYSERAGFGHEPPLAPTPNRGATDATSMGPLEMLLELLALAAIAVLMAIVAVGDWFEGVDRGTDADGREGAGCPLENTDHAGDGRPLWSRR